MKRVVLLDAGPLGVLCHPKPTVDSNACRAWLQGLVEHELRVLIPEIADYEFRREFIRARKARSLKRLDELAQTVEYLPITTAAMRRAAELWAKARQQGRPTSGDKTIDGDMILLGQALTLGVPDFVIATTNVGHLARFAPAMPWDQIKTKP